MHSAAFSLVTLLFAHASVDTTEYLNRGDLRILDTIHPTRRPDQGLIGETLRLKPDTVVVIEVMTFPAYSREPSQVAPGESLTGGMRITVRVYARDTTSQMFHPFRVRFAECPIELRVFRTAERKGKPIWSSRAASDSLSCPPREPNLPNEMWVSWPVSGILSDSLPSGRYFYDIGVRLADGRVLRSKRDSSYITAVPTPPTKDLSGIRFYTSVKVGGLGPRTLQTRAVARNVSLGQVQLSFGSCALSVSLSRATNAAVTAVWQSEQREQRKRPGVQHTRYACTAELRTRVLAPGDSEVFRSDIPVAEVLADSLPFGRYRVSATLKLVNSDLRPPEWERNHTFDLGELEIAGAADSFPQSRTIEGVRYTAAARVIKDAAGQEDTVRTLVLITNTTRQEKTIRLPIDCQVIAYAFRTTAARDSLPLVKSGWQASPYCLMNYRQFLIQPGERFVVQVDKPISEIPEPVRSGRYYLLVWVPGLARVMLSAGAIDLR